MYLSVEEIMKKLVYLSSAVVLFILVALSGCKSAPKAAEEIQPAPTVQEPVEPVEEIVVPVETTKTQDSKLVNELAQLEKDLLAAREEAISAGASGYFPEELAKADAKASSATAYRDAENYENALKDGKEALFQYQTLTNCLLALEYKEKIEKYDFAQYAPNEADSALENYQEAIDFYSKDAERAFNASVEALRLARYINNEGFKVLANAEIKKTEDAKALCDSIKAQTSAKEAYAIAQAGYTTGTSLGKNNDWEAAFYSYERSTKQFVDIYQEVTLKRNAADIALAAAKAQQDKSKALALKADEVIPLPEGVEGFDIEEAEALQ